MLGPSRDAAGIVIHTMAKEPDLSVKPKYTKESIYNMNRLQRNLSGYCLFNSSVDVIFRNQHQFAIPSVYCFPDKRKELNIAKIYGQDDQAVVHAHLVVLQR